MNNPAVLGRKKNLNDLIVCVQQIKQIDEQSNNLPLIKRLYYKHKMKKIYKNQMIYGVQCQLSYMTKTYNEALEYKFFGGKDNVTERK